MTQKTVLAFPAICAFALGIALNMHKPEPPPKTALIPNQYLVSEFNLVNFWAPWCPPCVEEIPELNKIHLEYKQHGLSVVGIAIDTEENVNAFEEKVALLYPSFAEPHLGNTLMESAGNPHGALPFTILVNRKGDVLYRYTKGILHYEDAEQLFKPLIK